MEEYHINQQKDLPEDLETRSSSITPIDNCDNGQEFEVGEEEDEEEEEEEEEEEDSQDDEEELDRYWPPPLQESVELVGSDSSKTVSALAFNSAGTRFATGGHDFNIRIWDFNERDYWNNRRGDSAWRNSCVPRVINNIDFSNEGNLILVIPDYCQAVILQKDGSSSKMESAKGDQYLTDMSKTKGHVQALNDGCWNPKSEDTFITCSNDCTVRIWDLNNLKEHKSIIKTRSPKFGIKTQVNVCKYTRDALTIVAGCYDGSVMMWDTRRKFINTSASIAQAHSTKYQMTGLDFSYGANKFCTRSQDEKCKIWDMRKLKVPLSSRGGFETSYPLTDCSFSPDDKYIVTGTSITQDQPKGQLLFLDVETLETKFQLETTPGSSVIRTKWHPKINHIAYTCSKGTLCVTCDKRKSMDGLLLNVARGGLKRKRYLSKMMDSSYSSSMANKRIITPHALPLFRDEQASSSFAKIRQDPKRSYKPELPLGGTSQGGRIVAAGSTLSSYIARNIAKPKDDGGLDIRERILRHAEEAEKDPHWFKEAKVSQQQQHKQQQQQQQHQHQQQQQQQQNQKLQEPPAK